MNILVTGSAGFIGFHLSKRLLELGHNVIGIDNLSDYYDVNLKLDRLQKLIEYHNTFTFLKIDISNTELIKELFKNYKFDRVINLAAQTGVRYSLINPHSYIQSNILGFLNILECCKNNNIEHLIFASSTSVYGSNIKVPFSVEDKTDSPVSLYAATKKSNELMAHSYSHPYKLPCTGLRFFSVYGPLGRPDVALFHFTKSILEDKEIEVYNYGIMKRDLTYIDDIVESIIRVLNLIPTGEIPFRVLNVGNDNPVELLGLIKLIEDTIGKKAKKKLVEMQPGDILNSWADVKELYELTGFKPITKIEEGVKKFYEWYKEYYQV